MSFVRLKASVRGTGFIHSATKAHWKVKKIFGGGVGKLDLLLPFAQDCQLTFSSNINIAFIFIFIYNLSFNTNNSVEITVQIPHLRCVYQYELKF